MFAGKNFIAANSTMAVSNITISAQSESQVQQIMDAVKTNQGLPRDQQAHLNVTVIMDPAATSASQSSKMTSIVDTASQYIES